MDRRSVDNSHKTIKMTKHKKKIISFALLHKHKNALKTEINVK